MFVDIWILAYYFKVEGYVIGMVGKWGLGNFGLVSIFNKMGFDFFFGYNCQWQVYIYYLVYLYKNELCVYLCNDIVVLYMFLL